MNNQILILSLDKKFKKFEKEVKITVGKVLKILKKDNVLVEIYLADSRKMRFLNKKFRNKDKAADILSFVEPKNFTLPPSKAKKLGEIYLKLPPADFPLNQLVIHGLLHLLGYTHKSKNDTILMEKREKFLISKI